MWSGCAQSSLRMPSEESSRFKIGVFTRFRPAPPSSSTDSDDKENQEEVVQVTLPLHQRLQLIKMSRGLRNNSQALKVLRNEGNWFGEKWRSINLEKKQGSGEVASVAGSAEASNDRLIASVQSIDPGTGRVIMVAPDVGLREFCFDAAFPVNCSQESVYETTARMQVVDFLNGFNASLIVYGQTGSGKTHTMFGDDVESSKKSHLDGIVPRACAEIFQALDDKRQKGYLDLDLSISYVEIYGDQVTDLLRFGQRCGHSKAAAQRFVLNGAAQQSVSSMEDLEAALRTGDAQKRRAATAMNDRSSRAHSLLILSLIQSAASTGVTVSSKIFFADLGGSEQVKKSKIETGASRAGEEFSTGFALADRMREAVYINLGLLALKKCIEALNNKSSYVPYADSKLTMLLSPGLGGDCKTSIIVCGSMEPKNAIETMAALRFGEKCALIETEARNQASILAGLLEKLERDIADLEVQIVSKESWKVVDVTQADLLAEEGSLEATQGGIEVKKVTVLVGAEKERKLLEQLLTDRLRLTGVAGDKVELVGELKYGKVGFGGKYAEQYGLGKNYDMDDDLRVENERFAAAVDPEAMPAVLRVRAKQWIQSMDTAEKHEQKIKKLDKRRNRLVYSGMSSDM